MPEMFSRRDVDMLKMQQELMRRASLLSPKVTLPGDEQMILRQFAQETLMLMRSLYPDKFKDTTLDVWWEALKQYVATRRPEFRGTLMASLKKRYSKTPPEGKPSELLASQAAEGMQKKAGKKDKPPTLSGDVLRGATLMGGAGTLLRGPANIRAYQKLRGMGVERGPALRAILKRLGGTASILAAMGGMGGAVAHPFARKDWEKRHK